MSETIAHKARDFLFYINAARMRAEKSFASEGIFLAILFIQCFSLNFSEK